MRRLLSALALPFLLAPLHTTSAFADRAPPPDEFKVEDGRLVPRGELAFETGTATLTPASARAIQHAARYLEAKPYVSTMRVEGHVAAAGDPVKGQALSEQRALTVARALVSAGVDCKRLLPVGFGDTKPRAENSTVEGRAQNTRIELVNAALRGKAIGGMPTDGGGRVAGDPCATP